MAKTPTATLNFLDAARGILPCPDCARRTVDLPKALPAVGDDFNWSARDYDSIRLFMLEELAARFPERRKWTPADVEVVLLEQLAALLDQLSDMADRVAAEATLETARRPESVRRLLGMIGYDAVEEAHAVGRIKSDPDTHRGEAETELDESWLKYPQWMDAARAAGPRSIHTQHRMVTLADYAERIEEHPLVLRAVARKRWTGSWTTIRVSVVGWHGAKLDDAPLLATTVKWDSVDILASGFMKFNTITPLESGVHVGKDFRPNHADDAKFAIVTNERNSIICRGTTALVGPLEGWINDGLAEVNAFNAVRDVVTPPFDATPPPTIRVILQPYIDLYRMVGQEVVLDDARPVPVMLSMSVQVASNYFQSEVAAAVSDALGTKSGGFFEPGRLRFGEDLYASDVIAAVMGLDGVEQVCLNRFKRLGTQFPDARAVGRIPLGELEIAVCDNEPADPSRGYWRLTLHGGRRG